MYYVYLLKSLKNGQFYVGFTADLRKRVIQHNDGKSPSTKPYRPWELVFYEAYKNRADARRREHYFKTTKGKSSLKMMVRESVKML